MEKHITTSRVYAANMPGLKLQDRIDNVRATARREVNILKDAFGDIKERLDADSITEPPSTRNLGGLLGQRGSLAKLPIITIVKTMDNGFEHVQGMARINRSQLR